VIATSEEYRRDIETAGIGFAPVRPSMAEVGDYQVLVTKLFDVRRGPEILIRELVMPHLRVAYDDLSRAADGADLVVSHPLTVTLPLVAEIRRLPWVATVLSPLSFMSRYDPPVIAAAPWLRKLRVLGPKPYGLLFDLLKLTARGWEAPLRDFRKALGLAPARKMAIFEGQFSPLGNLALFDPQLAGPQPDWPANVRVCGTPIHDGEAPDPGVRADLERFLDAGAAPIVFALGSSAVWVAGDFWDKAVEAARRLGRRAILVTGPVTRERLPDGVRAYPYLPYSIAFPRAAAVVHQAGIGTLAQALRAGRPQLIVPVAFDQPDNARHAAALGLARVIPFQRVTARRLSDELAALLGQPEYARRARTVAADLAGVDGAAAAAETLIAVAERAGTDRSSIAA
jgi:UDP:flavonoid glycosyltransferase YjiC (YdhE family)